MTGRRRLDPRSKALFPRSRVRIVFKPYSTSYFVERCQYHHQHLDSSSQLSDRWDRSEASATQATGPAMGRAKAQQGKLGGAAAPHSEGLKVSWSLLEGRQCLVIASSDCRPCSREVPVHQPTACASFNITGRSQGPLLPPPGCSLTVRACSLLSHPSGPRGRWCLVPSCPRLAKIRKWVTCSRP